MRRTQNTRTVPSTTASTVKLAAIAGLLLLVGSARAGTTWHVDADASCSGDGLSWGTAFCDLQDALAIAVADDEIWVAAGVYTPADPDGPRDQSFVLVDGVGLYGGFEGTETSFHQRRFGQFDSVLSGDLAGDDIISPLSGCGLELNNNSENSYHVVVAQNVSSATVLDGFTITGGYASTNAPPHYAGAGIFCDSASPTVIRCDIRLNLATLGGGAIIQNDSDPVFLSTRFYSNEANGGAGGAAQVWKDSGVEFIGCLFDWNRHISPGGEAGAVYVSPPVTSVLFSNCTITQNTSTQHYDGVFVHPNVSGTGKVKIYNTILWGNGVEDFGGSSSVVDMRFSCIGGGFTGEGNFTNDPMFIDMTCQASSDPNPRLLGGSPCIDAANSSLYGGLMHDILGQGRAVDDAATADAGGGTPSYLDVGAVEFQAAGECLADFNQDGSVNTLDVLAFLNAWVAGCP